MDSQQLAEGLLGVFLICLTMLRWTDEREWMDISYRLWCQEMRDKYGADFKG